jgi:hypothetical protein
VYRIIGVKGRSPSARDNVQKMRAASIPIQQFLHLFAFRPGKQDYLARFAQGVTRGA